MTYSGAAIASGEFNGRLSNYNNEGVLFIPGRAAFHYQGRAVITTVGATSWVITDRAGNQPVLPVGAQIYRVAFKIPTGLVATTGERLKVAAAVADAAGANNTLSAAAASSTFAVADVLTDTAIPGGTALSASSTLRLFSANAAGTALGSGVSVASGTRNIDVHIMWTMPTNVPSVDFQGRARPKPTLIP